MTTYIMAAVSRWLKLWHCAADYVFHAARIAVPHNGAADGIMAAAAHRYCVGVMSVGVAACRIGARVYRDVTCGVRDSRFGVWRPRC